VKELRDLALFAHQPKHAAHRCRIVLGLRNPLLVVLFGWVLFRAPDLPAALSYASAMLGLGAGEPGLYQPAQFLEPSVRIALVAGAIGSVPWWPRLRAWRVAREGPAVAGLELAGTLWLLGVLGGSVVLLSSGTHNPFIYFRF
jgi:alginate O-acetyltransferase complex protein AlgI